MTQVLIHAAQGAASLNKVNQVDIQTQSPLLLLLLLQLYYNVLAVLRNAVNRPNVAWNPHCLQDTQHML
jgi:hypothetical protein